LLLVQLISACTEREQLAATTTAWRIIEPDLAEIVAFDVLVYVFCARVHLDHELLPDQSEPPHAREPCAFVAR
jgi:hypothetical protein